MHCLMKSFSEVEIQIQILNLELQNLVRACEAFPMYGTRFGQ